MAGGSIAQSGRVHYNVPVRCDGAGTVRLETDVTLGYGAGPRYGNGEILLQARSNDAVITIGSRTVANNNLQIIANRSVRIGTECLIGELVSIYDSDFHETNPLERMGESDGKVSEVVIGNNVWIGSRSIILKGTTIGDNTVIAAGSIVAKSIPANVIAGGNPAKVIKEKITE
ncbi:MAG: acyltransferase [Pontiellaceae bacterium]|nr:acyltransferase [Pontiellaceae bacterium]MBN2784541.1 acyltransferase [Pontiellaceae bacterium]